ncbi:MAG TPA: cell wall-binding repeat-containing protein, partial [Thermoplasmatales archaeon]|nr:cell wall-binding repeat-containing protein [Thermoplasmatales archaeon]
MLCKKTMTLTVILLIFSTSTIAQGFLVYKPKQTLFSHDKQASWDAVIIPDNNPFYGVLGSSLACWYNKENNETRLLPLLVQKNGLLTEQQKRFLNQYLTKNGTLLVIGEHLNTTYDTTEVLGSPTEVAAEVSTKVFKQSSTVLILPYEGNNSYKLSLIAAPLASYLNIPILFYDNNEEQLQQICKKLNSTKAFVVGDIQLTLPNINIVKLRDEDAVQNTVLTSIKTVFGEINYITLTNPSDIISPQIINSYETTTMEHIENIKVTVLGREINIIGKDTKQQLVYIPEGINWVRIYGEVNVTQKGFIDPIISLYLYDPQKNVVAYSLSPGYDIGKTYVETLTCDAPGNYTLTVKLYNGVKGGYFL